MFDFLDVASLPKLSHFSIQGIMCDNAMWRMYQNCHRPHYGISKLEIKCFHCAAEDVQGSAKIATLFPCVTEFGNAMLSGNFGTFEGNF